VYYVRSPDYNVYMDRQQSINLALKAELDRRAISFATPTQTLVVHTPDGEVGAGSSGGTADAVGAITGAAIATRGAAGTGRAPAARE
jgi:hypothetical protein